LALEPVLALEMERVPVLVPARVPVLVPAREPESVPVPALLGRNPRKSEYLLKQQLIVGTRTSSYIYFVPPL